jgi:hypothetical protein
MEGFTNAGFSFEVSDTAASGGDEPGCAVILLHGFRRTVAAGSG